MNKEAIKFIAADFKYPEDSKDVPCCGGQWIY